MSKKKILSIISIFVFLFASNTFAKTYKIGYVEDYYPYILINADGEPDGIIIDWWKMWSLKTGVDIEFVPMDIQSCIDQTQSGKIDAIAGLFYSDERAEYLDFSEPLIRMRTAIFLKNKIKADSIHNIINSVGVVENSLSYLYLQENYPQVKLITFKSNTQLINAIYLKNIEGFT